MAIFSICLRAKIYYQSFHSFSPRRGLKVSIAHKMMVQSNLLENRWLEGGGKLDAYLFGLGLCVSICPCVCMCMYFSVLDKLTIHSIWISSCLGKTSSTMDNGISDIWIIFEFCFVKIAHVKFGRSSLLILVAPWRATCLMGLKSFCCRRHWQGLSLCETSAHAVISEITATAQNWMKLFSMFESCVELCAHSFTAQT